MGESTSITQLFYLGYRLGTRLLTHIYIILGGGTTLWGKHRVLSLVKKAIVVLIRIENYGNLLSDTPRLHVFRRFDGFDG